jgi:hypothetical protein
MLVNTDFAPALTKQHLNNRSQKHLATILRQPAIKPILTVGQDFLTLFAVVSGVPDALENLDEMGIYLGPTHA